LVALEDGLAFLPRDPRRFRLDLLGGTRGRVLTPGLLEREDQAVLRHGRDGRLGERLLLPGGLAGAGGIGGFAGALLAADVGYISPDSFGLNLLVLILAVSVIGGVRSVWGAVAGAIIVEILAQVSSEHADTSEMLYGLGFLFIILILPSGVAGLIEDVRGRGSRLLRARRKHDGEPSASLEAQPVLKLEEQPS